MTWYSTMSARFAQVRRAVEDGARQTLEGSISTETGPYSNGTPDGHRRTSGDLNLLGVHGMRDWHGALETH